MHLGDIIPKERAAVDGRSEATSAAVEEKRSKFGLKTKRTDAEVKIVVP